MDEKCKKCGEPMIVGHICKNNFRPQGSEKIPNPPAPPFCTWKIRNGEDVWKTECGAKWPPLLPADKIPSGFLFRLEEVAKFCPYCGKRITRSHSIDAAWITEQLLEIRKRTTLDESIYDAGQYICQFLDYLNFPEMAKQFRAILDGE